MTRAGERTDFHECDEAWLHDENAVLNTGLASCHQTIEQLCKDLVRMLPRSSDTMSALRQREITDFVLNRLAPLRIETA